MLQTRKWRAELLRWYIFQKINLIPCVPSKLNCIPSIPVSQSKETATILAKTKQYTGDRQNLQWEIDSLGLTPDLYHPSIVATAAEVARKQARSNPTRSMCSFQFLSQEELKEISELLAAYSGLPPDIQLASLALEEARRKLAKVEEEFNAQLKTLCLE